MRWLFHLVRPEDLVFGAEDDRYTPASLAREGFIHASFKDAVRESRKLYFGESDPVELLAIDPRRLDVPVEIVSTPRGPMPHVRGTIPRDAIRLLELDAVDGHDDRVTGTRIVFLAFEGMTLLDLVGPLDALSRIASMGFDPKTSCEVVSLTSASPDSPSTCVFRGWGAELRVNRARPPLSEFEVLVVPGGLGSRALAEDAEVVAYLESFPTNRLAASVCTGALLLGAAGRLKGRRATTHASASKDLARYGARFVDERVVDEGHVITAGGVTSGIELGLHLVRRLSGSEVATRIARQMETR